MSPELNFIKKSSAIAPGIGAENNFSSPVKAFAGSEKAEKKSFIPIRAASWWVDVEDLLWSEKMIIDKIKRRAAGFAEAKIDTAINFGFHIRFDFSNYFGQLHGYYRNVCEELHKYDIKFMDHYSCNHVERPRGDEEFRRLHKLHRHHTLLFHDALAAEYAQYEGHYFKDLYQVNLQDGSRGYAKRFMMEAFCHNNPDFLDMHKKYLQRLMKEVPMDGIQVDDMLDYAGPLTCGCPHCRKRFKKHYGHDIPGLDDKEFWGDITGKNEFTWGNYENPVFRDWLRMKADSVADHLKMVKNTIGDKPLMTCCSSSGPISLNAVSLNLERMSPYLDFFMLENCGINVKSVNWVRMDAEALHQKDMAEKRGDAPAIACSYTVYDKGGYLGWCVSRFWGVGNWSSTLIRRLVEDPVDAVEMENIIGPYNNWEIKNSNLNHCDGNDLVEVRLVNSRYCRENGWRDEAGVEQWDKAAAWSVQLVKINVGYRFVRCEELSDAGALCKEDTPLILDGIGCVSDKQFDAVKTYLSKGGKVWVAKPFGTHDEKGFKRTVPLYEVLLKSKYKNLIIIDSASVSKPLDKLIAEEGKFDPVLKQVAGDKRWAVRIRFYNGKPVIHFMNTALVAIPHPTLKDNPLAKGSAGTPVLMDMETKIVDNKLAYRIRNLNVPLSQLSVVSPELGEKIINAEIKNGEKYTTIVLDLTGVKVYAVAQSQDFEKIQS